MPGTRYNRFLDIHLVSQGAGNTKNLLPGQTGTYRYDFQSDFTGQRDAYEAKLNARFAADIANQVAMARMFGMPAPAAERAQILTIGHVLGSQMGLPMQNLEPRHFVACYVDLGSLGAGKPVIPELETLVKWVCASESAAGTPLRGKIRLNCHGAGTATAGLLMGKSNLSPEDLVDALMRHGLATRSMQYTGGLKNVVSRTARWKPDAEVNACEKCTKAFTLLRRRHHCRNCGGIFCDACTTKRRTLKNPLTENGRATGTVPDCRVCDACAFEVEKVVITDVKAGKGLAQITLAMCLAARTKEEFSLAKAGFARNSVGRRLVNCLSRKGVHGIQVSGSNEVIAWDGQKRGLTQSFSLKYPGMARDTRPAAGLIQDDFEGTGWAGFVDLARVSVSIPNSVLGGNEPNPVIPPIINDPTYASIRNQKIVPVKGGNAIAFGAFAADRVTGNLVNRACSQWEFTSWNKAEVPIGMIPELTRSATDIGGDAMPSFKAPKSPAASMPPLQMKTIMLEARARGVTIQRDPRDPTRLVVTGMEERGFKDYKIFEVT